MIKIITDSPSDIPGQELAQLTNVAVMAVPITVDGVTYREGVDLTPEDYYPILAAAREIPTHAQVTMMEFAAAYREAIGAGYKEIIVVTITSKGSGINSAAHLAVDMLEEEQPDLLSGVTIDIVDSKGYTYVYGQAVVAAARAALEGQSREAVLTLLRDRLERYQVRAGLTNLTYAKKSGRITSAAAFVGEIMGFRPVMWLKDGEFVTKSKVRGDHKLIEALAQECLDSMAEDGRTYYIVTADSMDNAQALYKLVKKKTKNPFGGYYRIGASVTTNAGPTVFGVLFPVQ